MATAEGVERKSRHGTASGIAVAVASLLVGGCTVAGKLLTDRGYRLHLGTTWPLSGQWEPRWTWWLLLPVMFAAVWIWQGPRLARTLSWRRLLAVAYAAGVAWPVALALVDGPDAISAPLRSRFEYLHDVPRVTNLGEFLPHFADHVVDAPQWTTHVGGHPPGIFGLFVLLDRVGLGGANWAAALCIGVGALSVPLVLATVRRLGSEELARRSAPFVVGAPAALWIATSADALFTGVSAAGICGLALAAGRRDRTGDLLAALGGLALGATVFLSYGLTLLAPLAVAVVAVQRRVRPLLIAGPAVLAVFALFALAGFDWVTGLSLATERVRLGPAWQDRPALYFAFANVAAVAIAAGPAAVAGIPLLRSWWSGAALPIRAAGGRYWDALTRPAARFVALPAAILLTIAVAIASGLSRGEAERIYLPFTVWLLPLAGLLPARSARAWLAASMLLAVLIAGLTRLSW